MNFKKPLLIGGAISTVALTTLAGSGVVSAASTTTDGSSNLVDKISQKFNLNKDDVKAVFDQNRAAHQAEHQKQVEADLTQAVTDGKLTSAQKDMIIAKLAELETAREANLDTMKAKTDAERKAAIDAERTALEKWASDNNIPMQYLQIGGHGMRGSGPR